MDGLLLRDDVSIPKNFFYIYLIDLLNHISMRTYKKEAECYLENYCELQNKINHNQTVTGCHKLALDLFYYILANLENKKHFREAYKICATRRFLIDNKYINKEKDIIRNFKIFTQHNVFYEVERMIKDIETVYTCENAEISELNAFHWNLLEFNMDTKDTTLFSYRFAWNYSRCEIDIDGHVIVMTIVQYYILKFVIDTQPTEELLQTQFKTCKINDHLQALCDNKVLFHTNDRYYYNNSFDTNIKNIIPLIFISINNVYDKKVETNKQYLIRSKIFLHIKRFDTIKENQLIELIVKSTNVFFDDVKDVLEYLKKKKVGRF